MNSHSFIERYFHSEKELMDIRKREYRDINTLLSYLTNLHSLSEKLKENFGVSLSGCSEFTILRMLRNYFHHVSDIDEIRMYVNLKEGMTSYHAEQLIIPMSVWAESVNNFIIKNTVSEKRSDYKKKKTYVKKELNKISEICDCIDILNNPEEFCRPLKLKCDDDVIELGFDIFKYIYNITNIIADECRKIDELSDKLCVTVLDGSYTKENNIPKLDFGGHLGSNVILTTQGYIFPKTVAPAI